LFSFFYAKYRNLYLHTFLKVSFSEIVADCPFQLIGKVSGDSLKINVNAEEIISAKINELQNGWKTSLEKRLTM
jgi:hypothetical protein